MDDRKPSLTSGILQAFLKGNLAILLILTYRSPILWIIPLTVIGTADRVVDR